MYKYVAECKVKRQKIVAYGMTRVEAISRLALKLAALNISVGPHLTVWPE